MAAATWVVGPIIVGADESYSGDRVWKSVVWDVLRHNGLMTLEGKLAAAGVGIPGSRMVPEYERGLRPIVDE